MKKKILKNMKWMSFLSLCGLFIYLYQSDKKYQQWIASLYDHLVKILILYHRKMRYYFSILLYDKKLVIEGMVQEQKDESFLDRYFNAISFVDESLLEEEGGLDGEENDDDFVVWKKKKRS